MNRDEAIRLAALLTSYWPRWTLPDKDEEVDFTLGAWCRLCADIPAEAMVAAVDTLAAAGETFPPPIGVIRKQALDLIGHAEGTVAPDLDQAWAEVMTGIRTYGFTAGPPAWSHPAIAAAVEAVTWRRLCLDDNLGMLHAHFRDFYKPAVLRTEALRVLPDSARQLVAGAELTRSLSARMRELEA